ncbi:MAG TPA: hypothetical protein VFX31_11995 [Ktedonobacterales bacterium]|nr:hypothetical protein [Ktedonobacterales bacterium]HEX5572107.1 hypothetical protein [Ktedonobacterales bacterium]
MRTMDPRATNQAQKPQQRRPALTRRESAMLSAASARVTSQRFPAMSKAALAFARQMQANPHVQAVMRDLADK